MTAGKVAGSRAAAAKAVKASAAKAAAVKGFVILLCLQRLVDSFYLQESRIEADSSFQDQIVGVFFVACLR